MGLNERTSNFVRKVHVKHFSLCLEDKKPVPGWEIRDVPNLQKPLGNGSYELVRKYYKFFGSLDGLIRKIEWYDTGSKFSHRFIGFDVYVEDLSTGETAIFDVPAGTAVYDKFVKTAANIDFKRPVEFNAWEGFDEKKGKAKLAFTIKQGGTVLKQAHTRENPNGMPPPIEPMPGKWNYDAQQAWLYQQMFEIVIPRVKELNPDWEPAKYMPLCIPDNDLATAPMTEEELQHTGPPVAQALPMNRSSTTTAAPTFPPPLTKYDDDDIPF